MSTGAPVAFPALFYFICVGHSTEDGCTIDLGFPLEGTMIRGSVWMQRASPHELSPLAILVGSIPRWNVG